MTSPLQQARVVPHDDRVRELPMSLIRGGPFYWVQEKARLVRPDSWELHRRLPLALAVSWLPLLVLAGAHGGIQDVLAVLLDYRVYARAFFAIPLLLIGHVLMEIHFREMVQHFLDANIIPAEDLSRFHRIMQKTRRLRDAWLPGLLIIAGALVQVTYLRGLSRFDSSTWIAGAVGGLTPAGSYSILVTNGLFLVLAGTVLWQWVIWTFVLWQISRLRLQLDATNGDLTGGLGFLSEVPRAFVPAVLAVSAVIGANWRHRLLDGQLTLTDVQWPAAAFAILVFLVFLLPLALFSPRLLREKRVSLRRYGAIQHLVSLQFRRKWTRRHHERVEDLLAGPDISSLADLSTAFRNIEQMFTYPFRKGTVIALLAALAVPLIPVITTHIPLRDVLKELLAAIS